MPAKLLVTCALGASALRSVLPHCARRFRPLPPDEPMTRKPVVTFARLTLGFEPRVPLDEGLAETVDWFRRGIVEPAMRAREEGPAASWLLDQAAELAARRR